MHPWQYHTMLHREGNSIKMGFKLVVASEVEGSPHFNQIQAKLKSKYPEEESTFPLLSFQHLPDTTKNNTSKRR